MCDVHSVHGSSKTAQEHSVQVEGPPPLLAGGSTPMGSTATPTLFAYESALAEENLRNLKRPREDDAGVIILGNRMPQQLRPNFLGPILKKRFLGGKG